MIKECQILLQNEAVIVARYDDIDVQFPTHKHKGKTVFVKYEDGRYTIVDNAGATLTTEKKNNKKTTKNSAKDQRKDEIVDV